MHLTRRTLLAGAGAASISTLLASCAGLTGQRPDDGASAGTTTLTFTTWGSDSEIAAYKALISKFEKANKGVRVRASFVPYAQMFTGIDAALSAGNAPDVFRAGYGQIGGYAAQDQLLDLSSYFDASAVDAFIPAFWQAVNYEDKPFGVPQQTDTSAIVYNKDQFSQYGVGAVPDSLDNAWSFEEFERVMADLRGKMPAKRFPFAYNWQLAGSARWLSWLFSTGGRLLNEDLTQAVIESPEGERALDYTKAFFEKQYVPQNSSTKSNTYSDTTWLSGATAMVSAGNFLLPSFADAKFEWGVTYLPQDERGADDLGGNALVATKASEHADLAAEFLRFMVTEEAMSEFCAPTLELPTLEGLVGKDLGWDVPDDVMPVFVDQATTITPGDVAQLSVPSAAAITNVLTDQLEAAFRQGQSTQETLANIAAGVDKAVGG